MDNRRNLSRQIDSTLNQKWFLHFHIFHKVLPCSNFFFFCLFEIRTDSIYLVSQNAKFTTITSLDCCLLYSYFDSVSLCWLSLESYMYEKPTPTDSSLHFIFTKAPLGEYIDYIFITNTLGLGCTSCTQVYWDCT